MHITKFNTFNIAIYRKLKVSLFEQTSITRLTFCNNSFINLEETVYQYIVPNVLHIATSYYLSKYLI